MSWLNSISGDRFSLFSASFFVRHFAFAGVVFAALFAALPAQFGTGGSKQFPPDSDLGRASSATETLAHWLQPSTAAAAPRHRQRARNARTQTRKTDIASETAPEQSTPALAPLTPYIQIWPQAHPVKSDAPEAMAQLSSQNFAHQDFTRLDFVREDVMRQDGMHVAGKGDRLAAVSSNDEDIVQADELSELDRAAPPLIHPDGLIEARAQPVALTATDGRAAPDAGETTGPVSRFLAFAESVKAIPQAPWFDSVLIVMAGVISAFAAARFFMRA